MPHETGPLLNFYQFWKSHQTRLGIKSEEITDTLNTIRDYARSMRRENVGGGGWGGGEGEGRRRDRRRIMISDILISLSDVLAGWCALVLTCWLTLCNYCDTALHCSALKRAHNRYTDASC